ncbi:MAG: hypothetical protein K8T10_03845, partial [Candidatus Eremiobacteraeota bacterium]|nr:hypothetical protein [Candidatus Eremiobacteraeota bacterium]
PLDESFPYEKLSSFLLHSNYQKYDIEGQESSCYSKFRLLDVNSLLENKSYDEDITFTLTSRGILFEFSAPKYAFGHSSLLLWDLNKFLENFYFLLTSVSDMPIPNYKDWIIKRIDICFNYVMSSYQAVKDTLSWLKTRRIKGKLPKYNTIPYWSYRNRTVKFYSKFDEMQAHKRNYYCDIATISNNSRRILRFEEEWRSAYLVRFLKVHSRDECTVGLFLHSMLKYNLSTHINRLIGDMTAMSYRINGITDILDIVNRELSRPNLYIKFLLILASEGIDKAKKLMPSSTFYNRRRKLKSIGIDIDLLLSKNDKAPEELELKNLTNSSDEEAHLYDLKIHKTAQDVDEEMSEMLGVKPEQLDSLAFIGSPEWRRLRDLHHRQEQEPEE